MNRTRGLFYLALLGTCLIHNTAYADTTDAPAPAPAADQTAAKPINVVIHALDTARNSLSPDTGSSTYNFSPKALNNLPQGGFTPINEVLLQAPGVAQDSYGQLHIRGDHADLQYRINGIIIPEGISGFGQTLDTHFANKIDLLTGVRCRRNTATARPGSSTSRPRMAVLATVAAPA